MLRQISILLEILAVFVCIHRLYGKKVKVNIKTVAAYLGCIAIYSVIDRYKFRIILSLTAYLIIEIYCIYSQKDSRKGAAVSTALTVIIVAAMQFLYTLMLNAVFADRIQRMFTVNLLVLASFIWGFPKYRLCLLRKNVEKYNGYVILTLSVGVYIALLMLLQEVFYGKAYLQLFVFLIPIIGIIALAMEKWSKVQREKEGIQKELQVLKTMQEKYDELLKRVKMKQHGFMNHMAAMLATQYTCKSYDMLVKVQNEYCGRLIQENRHYNLLRIESHILAGYLYSKFQEIESLGINIECEIRGAFRRSIVSDYHLIEMLGILLDNAAQATKNSDEKKIDVHFVFLEKAHCYQFKVCNRFPYISYDEISSWFQMGKSTKGEGHGLGLYYIKCLCEELNCRIIFENVDIAGENWIEFVLEVQKADGK